VNELSAIASFFKGGGAFMYVILGTGVLIAAIVVERFIVIGRAAAFNSKRMADDLVRSIGSSDMNTARNVAMSSHAPAARVAQAIMRVAPAEETRLQAAGDDAATLALPPLARRLPHLQMLANAATLLGLLGTIFGLTTAFSAVGAADPAQRSAFLAAGISQALNTTAFGLIIAVPPLLRHGWLAGMVESITEQVDDMNIRVRQAFANAAGRAQVTPMPQRNATLPTAAVQPIRRAAGAGQ
jgi:biopolymer transport protein ExbB/TolQ